MWLKLFSIGMIGGLVAVADPLPAQAGAGQSVAGDAGREVAVTRQASAGHARDFDWHRGKPGGQSAAPVKRGHARLHVSGRGGWVCSPAGAGAGSSCQPR